MCSSEVERKRRHQKFKKTVKNFYLPTTVCQTQTMCSSEVERKIKTPQVQETSINVKLSLTGYSVADTDDV